MTAVPGVTLTADGARFAVRARDADSVMLCLFDGDQETRIPMQRDGEMFVADTNAGPGARYGYRADGPWAPQKGLLFDSAKLLVDPYAVALDRRFSHDQRLTVRGEDTAAFVPKALVTAPLPALAPAPPLFRPRGLIYELNVRAFTHLHPDVPEVQRGTVAALAHPAIIAHLQKLHVNAVELMPIVAWIDERHLPPLGLTNAWGYNPVALMALDPGLVPGGMAELRATVAALRDAGIGVILDLVFNHTGESDAEGPVLSMRGLDSRYYARNPDGTLINDTGTGNTLDCAQPMVRALVRDSLRHFVQGAGVDGFRFDLATVLARGPDFDPAAPIFAEIAADPLLADRVLIAEPWDVGAGGYQLGNFPAHWLEWNDRYRDDVRRFWRGDSGSLGDMATRMTGSFDIFHGKLCRSVNFLAAHDGFTLADVVAYGAKHNDANGENNRDGHDENFSWNDGAEGATDDPLIRARRLADIHALLATLFLSRGTIQLSAGDEFGHSQQGNNNAYAQDNELTWLDWANRDLALEDFTARLAGFRAAHPEFFDARVLDHADWRDLNENSMTVESWQAPDAPGYEVRVTVETATLVVRVDRRLRQCTASLITETF